MRINNKETSNEDYQLKWKTSTIVIWSNKDNTRKESYISYMNKNGWWYIFLHSILPFGFPVIILSYTETEKKILIYKLKYSDKSSSLFQ